MSAVSDKQGDSVASNKRSIWSPWVLESADINVSASGDRASDAVLKFRPEYSAKNIPADVHM
jgi:hypothetical protein